MKQKLTLSMVFVIVLAVLVTAGGSAYKAYAENVSSPYTATLRYYDDIQITYTLNYPNGGVWTGAGDVPIGGARVSDQIYCADPFVPFHSMATSSWDNANRATKDEMSGYVAAAPWASSAAIQQNDDALRWLVFNGYRGNYLLTSDPVSNASVDRLNTMYPSIGPVPISKKIAVMATKVAIWKVIAGDNLTILRTSLNANEQVTFDNLVASLIADAQTLGPTTTVGTELSIAINGGFLLDHSDTDYDYYGPFTVTANLENQASGDILSLIDKVFLTVNGPNLSVGGYDVAFVDAADTVLSDDQKIYGTSQNAAYVDSFSNAGGICTSSEFYLRVPSSRVPYSGEHLTIMAQAGALNVPLAPGTPMTLVYEGAGVQDWNYVQAFIGAANDGMEANLYAQTRYRSNDLGAIQVSKNIAHASPLDDGAFFFRLYHSDTSSGYNPATDAVVLSDCIVSHALSVDYSNNTFSLRNGGAAVIDGLPMTGYYWAEELTPLPAVYGTPLIDVLIADGALPPQYPGFITEVFQMKDDYASVRFTNTKNEQKAHLYIGKVAIEYFSDGRDPAMILNTPYSFVLECSADGGSTWTPYDLTDIFKSDNGVLNADPTTGKFTLETMDTAFIDANPALQYRLKETDPGADYIPLYAFISYEDKGGGSWNYVESSAVGAEWNTGDGFYTTEQITVTSGGYCFLAASNIRATLCNLSVSKTVVWNSSAYNPDLLYSFQVFYMDDNLGVEPPFALPLSTVPSPDTMLISGILADRITNDAEGNPVFFGLKDGETATIEGLPAGSYTVREVPGARFTTTYKIGSGADTRTAAGGLTESFLLTGDLAVAFTNTDAEKTGGGGDNGDDGGEDDGEDDGGSNNGGGDGGSNAARTGDSLIPWVFVALALLSSTAFFGYWLFRNRRLN